MILINKNANYSNERIGVVDVKMELLDKTKEILARYSRELSNAETNAFNLFIYEMEQQGLLAKLQLMCLPILAANVQEAMQDAFDGTNCGYSTSDGEIDLNASLTLEDKAIKVIPDAPTVRLKYKSLVDLRNSSQITYIHKCYSGSVILGWGNAARYILLREKNGNTSCVTNMSQIGVYGSISDNSIFLSSQDMENVHIMRGKQYAFQSHDKGSEAETNWRVDGNYFGVRQNATYVDYSDSIDTWMYSRSSVGLIAIGSSLTKDEMLILKSSMDKMMSAFYGFALE